MEHKVAESVDFGLLVITRFFTTNYICAGSLARLPFGSKIVVYFNPTSGYKINKRNC